MTREITYRTVEDRSWWQQDNLDVGFYVSDSIDAQQFRARAERGNLRQVAPGQGNLVSSMVKPDQHLAILDLDIPHAYIPSRTTGHGHLYLNHRTFTDHEYYTFMAFMKEFGVVRAGSLEQLKAYSCSLVRRPPGRFVHIPHEERW